METEKRKLAWVKWERLCELKEKRGLGIKDLKTFNLVLLGRWTWRIFCVKDELWLRVLTSKYGCLRDCVEILKREKGE